MECIVCARELPEGSAFCLTCGSAQTVRYAVTCPECSQLLPPGSAFCNHCGFALESRRPEVSGLGALTAERRVTSVLFADLVGSTSLSESRDSEDVRHLLTEYFDVCATIIRRYGGTVEKFIGDAVMAVWGIPTRREDDAERAVRAGLELVTSVTALGERLGLPQLALRVGVVTGEVAATPSATDHGLVAGDPVNTAARVQTAAGPGEVWVDATTRTLTAAVVTYFDAGEHLLKGKAERVQLFRAGAVVTSRGISQRVDGLEAPLVGRQRDLRLLKELFHSTEESARPSVVVLDGEAGVGKSRLGWEFERYVEGLGTSVAWYRGRCLSYGDGVAFWALSEAVRARLGLVEDDVSAVVLAALDRCLDETLMDEAERTWLRPRLASLLGIETREFARDDLFAAWATFLERVGEGDPVILLIDDAHHADQGLLGFVDHVVANCTFGLFVLLLARPELLEGSPVPGGRRASVLRLERLPDHALRELVDGLVEGLDGAACDSLVRRSEGIPLFAVETVRALIDAGVVGPVEGRYVVLPGQSVDLARMGAPASLHALVAARLDALAPWERRVMGDASVLGLSFTREGIGILAHDVPELDGVLDTLQRRELIATDNDLFSAERGQFRFVHAVVRQVAYSTLARSERRARHLLVADHLSSDHERPDDMAQVIARHLLDAAEMSVPGDGTIVALRERASTLLVSAGARDCSLGAYADGMRAFHAALEILDDDATRAEVLSRAADAALRGYLNQTAMEDARAAVALFDQAGDVVAAAAAACHLVSSLGELGHLDEAVELAADRLKAVIGQPGAEVVVAKLARRAGDYLQLGGRPLDAAPFVDLALKMSELEDNEEAFVATVKLFGVQQHALGSVRIARLLFAGMAELARTNELWDALTTALADEANVLSCMDLDAAIDLTREAVDNLALHGLPRNPVIEANLCVWFWTAGRWGELDDLLTTSSANSSDSPFLAKMAAGSDLLLVWSGARDHRLVQSSPGEDSEVVAAHEVFAQFRELAHALTRGDRPVAAASGLELVDTELARKGVIEDLHSYWPLALRAALEADDIEVVGELVARLSTYSDRALPLALRGNRRVAQCLLEMRVESPSDESIVAGLEAGTAELAEAGHVVWEAHAHEDLGVWHLDHARQAEAERHLEVARSTYERLGARRWLERLEARQRGRSGLTAL